MGKIPKLTRIVATPFNLLLCSWPPRDDSHKTCKKWGGTEERRNSFFLKKSGVGGTMSGGAGNSAPKSQ